MPNERKYSFSKKNFLEWTPFDTDIFQLFSKQITEICFLKDYGSDIDSDILEAQLAIFKLQFKEENVKLNDIIEVMKKPGRCDFLYGCQ